MGLYEDLSADVEFALVIHSQSQGWTRTGHMRSVPRAEQDCRTCSEAMPCLYRLGGFLPMRVGNRSLDF